MHNSEVRNRLAKVKQHIITVLTTTDRLHGASKQNVSRTHLSVKFDNSHSIVLLRDRPPRHTPLNLRCIELSHA